MIAPLTSNVNPAVNFKGEEKKTGGVGKAVASAFLPGLGQFIDGRNKEGALFLGATAATGLGTLGLSASILNDKNLSEYADGLDEFMGKAETIAKETTDKKVAKQEIAKLFQEFSKKTPKSIRNKALGIVALLTAGFVLGIANIVDAFKGGKKEETAKVDTVA